MKKHIAVACLACSSALTSLLVFAAPPWPPVLWGYERVFYDSNGQAVGGIVACSEDYSYSWGVYTNSYEDFPAAECKVRSD